jgi:hypothetical protein
MTILHRFASERKELVYNRGVDKAVQDKAQTESISPYSCVDAEKAKDIEKVQKIVDDFLEKNREIFKKQQEKEGR